MLDTKSHKLNSKKFENQSFSVFITAQYHTTQSQEKLQVLSPQKYNKELQKWPKVSFMLRRESFRFHPKIKVLRILPSWILIEKNT